MCNLKIEAKRPDRNEVKNLLFIDVLILQKFYIKLGFLHDVQYI